MKTLALAWTCLLLAIPCSADIIYVKQGGTGSGTSWADPNGVLQWAINNSTSNDEIWVASAGDVNGDGFVGHRRLGLSAKANNGRKILDLISFFYRI